MSYNLGKRRNDWRRLERVVVSGTVPMAVSAGAAMAHGWRLGWLGMSAGAVRSCVVIGREGAVWQIDRAGVLHAVSAPAGVVVGAWEE